MIKFKNKENEYVQTVDGRKVWLSRSCAVAITLIFKNEQNEDSVLMVKRVDNMDTEPGKYCLPCGYLDYNESLLEAAIRETYEETGFEIDGNLLRPWYVNSDPKDDALQNVTHHFGGLISYNDKPQFKEQDDEIAWVGLIPLKDLDKYDIAFNHAKRIRQFVNLLLFHINEISS